MIRRPSRTLRAALERNARATADVRSGRLVRPVGAVHREVVLDERCEDPALVPSTSSATAEPGSSVGVLASSGGARRTVVERAPAGAAGSAPIEREERTVPGLFAPAAGSRFLALRASGASVLEAAVFVDGTLESSFDTVDFSPTIVTGWVRTAVPTWPATDLENGVVILREVTGAPGGEIITYLDLATGARTDLTMLGADAAPRFGVSKWHSSGPPVFVSTASGSPRAYAVGSLTVSASVSRWRLWRFDLPDLSNETMIAEITLTDETYAGGFWSFDRVRMSRHDAGETPLLFNGIDTFFFNGSTGSSATDRLLPGFPDAEHRPGAGGSAGADGAGEGFFWHRRSVADAPVLFGTLSGSGSGTELGFPRTWLAGTSGGVRAYAVPSTGSTTPEISVYGVYASGDTWDANAPGVGRFTWGPAPAEAPALFAVDTSSFGVPDAFLPWQR